MSILVSPLFSTLRISISLKRLIILIILIICSLTRVPLDILVFIMDLRAACLANRPLSLNISYMLKRISYAKENDWCCCCSILSSDPRMQHLVISSSFFHFGFASFSSYAFHSMWRIQKEQLMQVVESSKGVALQ